MHLQGATPSRFVRCTARTAIGLTAIWGQKRQARLLSLSQGVLTPNGDLHLSWSSFVPAPNLIDTDFNLYHLKMIAPERRKARAALYNLLDPEHRMQRIGYDYLTDETGAQFEPIPAGREFSPAHVEDGGLGMPAAGGSPMMRIGPQTRHASGPALRVLVLTNHFSIYSGSEIVAMQTAQWFARQGDLVTLGANSWARRSNATRATSS